ncbi:conjugal transfer protein TraH [Vibrio mediterranei]|uniref:conjugal transfer protein TraH n=1 Tax=Vibrio mediterranei TaxID=689 RepID=UPI00148B4771|nr:conjugal transfer protein TraH [Vibrio mediterranei]NOI23859.1 conjugal transfer protein TraH [Vibrio mediterranei]
MRKTILAAIIAASTVTAPVSAGGLQSEMDRLFNEMSNATSPGIHESQRRGVFTGGRYTAKTRIYEENLVAFTPPSWKAGCGGIDLFGGSFSFINAEQLVTMMRAVAANAKGYAFQLALDNVFPDGAKWMENFQKKVQQMNQHLSNSCQLAQGIVNDTTAAFDIQHKTKASIKATGTGLFDDVFASTQEQGGETPLRSLKDHAPDKYKEMIGNIVWKQLNKNAVSTWFTYGDTALLEAMLSLTGSVVVGDLVADESGGDTNPISRLPGGLVRLADLINGGQVKIYNCDDDCLAPAKQTVNLTSVRQKFYESLAGNDSRPGIIMKYSTNMGHVTDDEKALVDNLPSSLGSIIRNLSMLSDSAARSFADESSTVVASAMVYDLATQMISAAELAVSNTDSPHKTEVLEQLDRARSSVDAEYQQLTEQYGAVSDLITRYNDLIQNVQAQRLSLSRARG